jgi:hypothetical protein
MPTLVRIPAHASPQATVLAARAALTGTSRPIVGASIALAVPAHLAATLASLGPRPWHKRAYAMLAAALLRHVVVE